MKSAAFDKVFWFALGVLAVHVAIAIAAPLIMPYDPYKMHFNTILQDPSVTYWFGTDQFGRDVFSRVLAGGRTTMLFGLGSIALCLLIAVPIGMISGYVGGRTDAMLMRVMDIVMSFPSVLLGLLILVISGSSMLNLVIAIGIVYAPRTGRVVRSAVLAMRHSDFIQAAHARGERLPYILLIEILPCIQGPLIVEICIRLGYAILLGASFNYLGVGIQPPAADWGALISESRAAMVIAPWIIVFPALFLVSLVIALNLVGDGISKMLEGRSGYE